MDDFNKDNQNGENSNGTDYSSQNNQNEQYPPYYSSSNNAEQNNNGYQTDNSSDPNTTYSYSYKNQNSSGANQNQNFNGYQSYYTPNQPPVNDVPDVKKKNKKSLVVIISILVICLVLAGVGIFLGTQGYFASSGNSEKETTTASDSSSGATVNDSSSADTKDKNGNLTTVGVVKKVKDSCVGITVYSQQNAYNIYGFNGSNSQGSNSSGSETASGEGSGVLMYEDKTKGLTYILTCAHVISDGSKFVVTLNNEKTYTASMVGYDSQTDIGVLSIKATGLSVADFGAKKDIEIGEDCIAIGNPGGSTYANSVTKGIVSALDRPVSSSIGYDNECIQTDAAINPGNSGGALFNMQGQVIGINSSKIADTDYEGMGFSIPSDTAVDVANKLIKSGYVTGRAQIGIQYQSLSSYMYGYESTYNNIISALNEKGYKKAEGSIRIASINSNSSLKNTNAQVGDIIVAVDGTTLTSTDVLTSALSKKSPGDTVTLTLARIDNNSLKVFKVKCKLVEATNESTTTSQSNE